MSSAPAVAAPEGNAPVAPLIEGLPIISASPTLEEGINESLVKFIARMKRNDDDRNNFLDAVWTHRSTVRTFYAKHEVSQEMKIFKALADYGLPVNRWFADACEENVPFAGCGNVSWMQKMGDDGKMIDLSDELISFKTDEDAGKPETEWSAWPDTDDDEVPEEDEMLVKKIDLFRFILANPETMFHTKKYNADDKLKFLLHLGPGKLAYNIFMSLSSDISSDEVWSDVDTDMLHATLVTKEKKERADAEFCVLFPRVFVKMLLVLGLTNTRKVFKIMGTRYVTTKNSSLEGYVYRKGICSDALVKGKKVYLFSTVMLYLC